MPFSREFARGVAASAMAASVIGGTVTLAGPAQAASGPIHCKWSTKSFSLPGKPDVDVSLSICIQHYKSAGGYRYYKAWLGRASWDGGWFVGGKRFNGFRVDMRAEHGRTSRDKCRDDGNCNTHDLAAYINSDLDGVKSFKSDGTGVVYVVTKTTGWKADATVTYDVADDGKGSRKWDLNDTAAVR
ncbi:hypothetical protein [Streptomyces chattanoogensis]|uniref:hypothetical protein n=1 Tax=Streptomyces chattanoogensis TaxID=66876 RepID=UPI00368F6186